MDLHCTKGRTALGQNPRCKNRSTTSGTNQPTWGDGNPKKSPGATRGAKARKANRTTSRARRCQTLERPGGRMVAKTRDGTKAAAGVQFQIPVAHGTRGRHKARGVSFDATSNRDGCGTRRETARGERKGARHANMRKVRSATPNKQECSRESRKMARARWRREQHRAGQGAGNTGRGEGRRRKLGQSHTKTGAQQDSHPGAECIKRHKNKNVGAATQACSLLAPRSKRIELRMQQHV